MKLTMMKAKLHRATVTQSDLHYEGSISIDTDLLEASGILPFEKVDIWNITNGERFSTYVIKGKAGTGEIGVNGAAARRVQQGDHVIICAYCELNKEEAENFEPTVIILDDHNKIKKQAKAA